MDSLALDSRAYTGKREKGYSPVESLARTQDILLHCTTGYFDIVVCAPTDRTQRERLYGKHVTVNLAPAWVARSPHNGRFFETTNGTMTWNRAEQYVTFAWNGCNYSLQTNEKDGILSSESTPPFVVEKVPYC